MAVVSFVPPSCSMKNLRCCNNGLGMLLMIVVELRPWSCQGSPNMNLWWPLWKRMLLRGVMWPTRFVLFGMMASWYFNRWHDVGLNMKAPRMQPMKWWKPTTKASTRVGSSWRTMKGPLSEFWWLIATPRMDGWKQFTMMLNVKFSIPFTYCSIFPFPLNMQVAAALQQDCRRWSWSSCKEDQTWSVGHMHWGGCDISEVSVPKLHCD